MSIRHATETQLALYQAGELGLVERLRVRWHVNSCESCGNELAAFEEARAILDHSAGELPPDLPWDRLAAEMAANIHLGMEAGECVRPQPVAERPAASLQWSAVWRPGLAVGSLVVLLYAGTWAVTKKLGSQPTDEAGIVLEARPDSLEIRENGAAFSLVRASTASAAISVGTGGSLRARDIDEDTGQVTIYHVYAE